MIQLYRFIAIIIFFLLSFYITKSDLNNNGKVRVRVVPESAILCPGDEIEVIVYTEKNLGKNGKDWWVKAGGMEVHWALHQTLTDGSQAGAGAGSPYKSDGKTGSFSIKLKAASNVGTVEQFYFFLGYSEKDLKMDAMCNVEIISISQEDCDSLNKDLEELQKDLADLTTAADSLLNALDNNKVKNSLDKISKNLKNLKPGKLFTPARNLAIQQINELKKSLPSSINVGNISNVIDAMNAKVYDLLSQINKLDFFKDPTTSLFKNLSSKTDEELDRLMRQCEASNYAYSKVIEEMIGDPPDFSKSLHPVFIALVDNGGKYLGIPYNQAKNMKIKRIVLYKPYLNMEIINGPYKISQEYQNRLPKINNESREKYLKLIEDAGKIFQMGRVCESLTTWQGQYLSRKRAGNDKGAEDIRNDKLIRFNSDMKQKLKAKEEKDMKSR
ncbi:MAG: hypothetical protein IPM69_06795 [Ignavibacteria bacterium]|nr:hypothetical protein [Ignavibacteria bacterium]